METFDFPYHTYETDNPQSGTRVQFGGSYIFSAPPSDPDQRSFTLHYPTMKYYTLPNGGIDTEYNKKFNMMALINFYHQHKLHKSFLYNHPIHGTIVCRFQDPLKEPEGIPNGNGAVKEFTIKLLEMP